MTVREIGGNLCNRPINLLTRDGSITVTFAPALTPDQYIVLADYIKSNWSTSAELGEMLRKLAAVWGCEVFIDPC